MNYEVHSLLHHYLGGGFIMRIFGKVHAKGVNNSLICLC